VFVIAHATHHYFADPQAAAITFTTAIITTPTPKTSTRGAWPTHPGYRVKPSWIKLRQAAQSI
jgi:hypothetical protein